MKPLIVGQRAPIEEDTTSSFSVLRGSERQMETCMLGYEQAATATEIATWANDLIGKGVPGYPDYRIVKVIQFQLVPRQSGYDAMLLLDVAGWPSGNDQVALREEDVEVIEQITSSITEPPESETTFPE